MLQRPGAPANSSLITFRTLIRPDLPDAPSSFPATRLPDHRADYLTYEGPLSHNRGSVRRLARGLIISLTHSSDALDLTLDWGRGPARWLAAPVHPAPDSTNPTEAPWHFRRHA